MTGDNLARIERVSLQEAWPHEAHNFTPWLAENLAELGNALGVELELQGQEVQVGSRFLDILATERYDGRPVVIENQLNTTDNDHLSRLLIYAAGFDAQKVIWVASAIDDEHRQVLDWLNQRTDDSTQFYGVAVELWKIDNSRAAPHFKIVVAPNESTIIEPPPPPPKWAQKNISFRVLFVDTLKQEGCESKTRYVTKGAWCVLEDEDKAQGFKYFVSWNANSLGFEINLKGSMGWNQRFSPKLEARRSDIEPEICDQAQGEQVKWEVVEGDGKIVVSRPGNIYHNPESWDEYHDWIIAKFFKFKEVFTPLLAELSAAAGE